MKKFYPLALTLLTALGARSQCTPDASLTVPGVYPPAGSTVDTAYIRLPDAAENVAYSAVIQLVVIADTTIELIPGFPIVAPIDSLRIEQVNGLPAGMSPVCDVPSCTWDGGDNGCVELMGTPAQWGDFDIEVVFRAYVNLGILGDTSGTGTMDFKLLVTSPQNVYEGGITHARIGPNPASGELFVGLERNNHPVLYHLTDLYGRQHLAGWMVPNSGPEHRIDVSTLPSGLYLLHLEADGQQAVYKVMVQAARR